jgi:branched-chain amino acid transport system ATP-binding protein
MSPPLLSVRGVKAYYGNIAALRGIDLEVGEGEVVALIGANGAGKSTLMMTIFGNPRAREGSISFAGRDITRMPTHDRSLRSAGAEGRRIFLRMSVLEKLQIGAGLADATLQATWNACLSCFRLKERIDQRGGTLPAASADAGDRPRPDRRPRLLLLDEPSLGLAPPGARRIFDHPGSLR